MTLRTMALVLAFTVGPAARFSGQGPVAPISAAERAQLLNGAARIYDSLYLDRSLGRALADALRRAANTGRWSAIHDPGSLADSVTALLRSVAHDEHLRILYAPQDARAGQIDSTERARRRANLLEELADSNYGFPEVRILPGNIGLLRMNNFQDPSIGAGTLTNAMGFLTHTRALLIDVRRNGGGHSDQLALLLSYFFRNPTKVETSIAADSSIEQMWTYAVVPGARYGADKPVFVLTGATTFSAAEGLADILRRFGRATIVGARTRGGTHMGDFRPVSARFMAFVPTAAAAAPDGVEGVGIRPDVEVPESLAVRTAHLLALRRVAPGIGDPERRRVFERLIVDAQGAPSGP